MQILSQIVVFDAADMSSESSFWAAVLGGRVIADDTWHDVFDASGQCRLAVQHAPNFVAPQWPDGTQQQIHLDLSVDDPVAAHDEVVALGARVLQTADTSAPSGFQVYADPAGHPFCLCWG
jgi:predicted enzyme related to lactoylglutathione lyase